MRKQVGAAPSNTADAVPKSYVDARVVPNGGTAAQVLTKITDTDLDITWLPVPTKQAPSKWGNSITGSVTLAADTAYAFSLGGSGSATLTLPNAPADNTAIGLVLNIPTTWSVTVAPAGSDIIAVPNSNSQQPTWTLPTTRNRMMTLVYRASNLCWYVDWSAEVPLGGATNQLLAKNSAADWDLKWTTLAGVPAGGLLGQALVKNSNTNYDVGWIMPTTVSYTLGAPAVSSGTTETKLFSATVAANQAQVADVFRIMMHGISSSTGTLIFRVRVGATGTISDNVVWQSITSAAQAANQRAGFDAMVTVRSTTTVQCEGRGYAQAAMLPTLVAAVTTPTFAPTATWYITVSVTCSVGTFTAQQGSVEWL